jgi:translation initiation factor IF-2
MAVKGKPIRLGKAARDFNVGTSTIVEFLSKKGFDIETNPNAKLTPEMFEFVEKEYQTQKAVKEEAEKIGLHYSDRRTITIEEKIAEKKRGEEEDVELEIEEEVMITDTSMKKEVVKPAPVETAKPDKPEPEPVIEQEKEVVSEDKIEEPKEKKVEKPDTESTQEVEPVEKVADQEVEEKKEIEEVEKIEKIEKIEKSEETLEDEEVEAGAPRVVGKIDLGSLNQKTKPKRKTSAEKKKEREGRKVQLPDKKKVATKKVNKVEDEKVVEKKVEKPEIKVESKPKPEPVEEPKPVKEKKQDKEDENFIKTKFQKLEGPTILGKVELPPEKKKSDKKPVATSRDAEGTRKKRKRKRIRKQTNLVKPKDGAPKTGDNKSKTSRDKKGRSRRQRPEVSEEDVQKQIKETLAKLTGGGKSKAAKYRREKRHNVSEAKQKEIEQQEKEKNLIKVTEFVTANELASMMDVSVTDVISTCMSLGLFVSINQRLDAETLTLVADEFGYTVEFVSVDVQEAIHIADEEDDPENLVPRPPVVTVMGHVDHGKTKLLDFIRSANVVAGEAGGITQHIGAYEVTLKNGSNLTFLDTPGHEAFTAMRARGAQVTDIAIIVIAADDDVMPQTKEAINHAQAAGVPLVFAINKIDKPNANPEKIKEELSKMNILVEDWGGKYQSQEISAKQGIGIDELLEKVMLEAELLESKANPNKSASGSVIESALDKGRGYVVKLLVQDGTLNTGDVVIAGAMFGKVKAMFNERNKLIKKAGPSTPVLMLGLSGAPQAGDVFNVIQDEKEARSIATKRMQLQREQGLRTQKHVTLDEIGRRLAIGDFQELNIIVKGDVDGSVEALSDSLLKLGNEEIQVNVIHKSVGQISESDILLASASDAIIIGFQVRPSVGARKLAEKEQIDIRLYSIIYQAIEDVKDAILGMLAPKMEEKIICNVEIREIFKISKVGTIAGCMVLDGTITRNTRVRVIRDGIVAYSGTLGSLKRFKDDVKEVKAGYECGLNIDNFNDIKVGDIVEGYEEVEVKRQI